jgi:hypothetical protein
MALSGPRRMLTRRRLGCSSVLRTYRNSGQRGGCKVCDIGRGVRTLCQATRQRNRASKQNIQDAHCEEREAEHSGEVNFKGWYVWLAVHVLFSTAWMGILDASRTSGDSSATIIVGDAMSGIAWVAG